MYREMTKLWFNCIHYDVSESTGTGTVLEIDHYIPIVFSPVIVSFVIGVYLCNICGYFYRWQSTESRDLLTTLSSEIELSLGLWSKISSSIYLKDLDFNTVVSVDSIPVAS